MWSHNFHKWLILCNFVYNKQKDGIKFVRHAYHNIIICNSCNYNLKIRFRYTVLAYSWIFSFFLRDVLDRFFNVPIFAIYKIINTWYASQYLECRPGVVTKEWSHHWNSSRYGWGTGRAYSRSCCLPSFCWSCIHGLVILHSL